MKANLTMSRAENGARLWISMVSTLAALLFVIIGIFPLSARAADASPRFPDAAQVTADYPDEAQRIAAFSLLFDALNQAAPKPMSSADYGKDASYQVATNTLAAHEAQAEGTGSPAFRAFTARADAYTSDAGFVGALLNRYQLNGLPSYPRQTVTVNNPNAADEMKYDVPTHLPSALIGILIAGPIPMALAAWLVLRRSGIGRKIYPVPAPVRGGLPALPQQLQVVTLPGVRYSVNTRSGRVLDIQMSSRSSSHTHTSGGDMYQSPSGQVFTTPLQTYTTVTNIREMVIWIRTPEGREEPWTLYNSNFQCRVGQVISILIRLLSDGTGEILLAYNHASGVLEQCPALAESHEPRGNELGQWTANLVGAYVAWRVLAYFLPRYDPDGSFDIGYMVSWLVASFVLVVVSFFITTPLVKSYIRRRRNGRFKARYLPGYQQFFQQGRPVIP